MRGLGSCHRGLNSRQHFVSTNGRCDAGTAIAEVEFDVFGERYGLTPTSPSYPVTGSTALSPLGQGTIQEC